MREHGGELYCFGKNKLLMNHFVSAHEDGFDLTSLILEYREVVSGLLKVEAWVCEELGSATDNGFCHRVPKTLNLWIALKCTGRQGGIELSL